MSYALGTFPTAQIIGSLFGHDPTTEGSGNPGASNVYRVAGPMAGASVLLGDGLKGFAPALLGLAVEGRTLGLAAGVAAVVGHILPVTRLRRGGKGVATFGGMSIAMFPLVSAVAILVWTALMRVFRTASIGSLAVVATVPVGVAIRGRSWREVAVTAAASALVAFRHRSNLRRLLSGEEQSLR